MNGLPRLENYDVVRLIAEGGTARVYWGVDRRSGFAVAIKELKLRHMENTMIREKFQKMETQLMLYAQHPNIPRVVDFIYLPERKQMFLVMDFIEGRTLEYYLYRECGLMPEQKALPIFLEILDTVAFLHKARIPHMGIKNGVLHLDIKSNNIILQPDGKIKLIDLGIASRMGETSNHYGTPPYMPPEQTQKDGVVGRYTDIFALGVLLFEMLTAHLPFMSDNENTVQFRNEIRRKIAEDPTPVMKQYYPFISDELQFIVERALAKNPLERYQSCEDFAKCIKDFMKKSRR